MTVHYVWFPAGTIERGRRERARQEQLIVGRGGIDAYIRGCVWCGSKKLDGCDPDMVSSVQMDAIRNG